MRTFALLLIPAGIVPVVCTAQQQGSISGTVASTTGEPLKNVNLRLQGQPGPRPAGTPASPGPQAYAASSDAQGNFRFDDLDPAQYALSAQKPGYLAATYNSLSNPLIDLTSGQTLTGIAVKMTPQGAITGTITDEDGDPVPNARVMLARWGYQNGRKKLMLYQGSSSNFEGVFSIGNLDAGSYVLFASPQPASNAAQGRRKGPEDTYTVTYYPSVMDSSSAGAIQVTAGAVLRGMDIRMRKAASYRIRGKVAGEAVQNGSVRVLAQDGLDTSLLGLNLNANLRQGAFEIAGVLPGVYTLDVQLPAFRAADGSITSPNLIGRQTVSVGNADVDDVVLQLGPGAEITGKIMPRAAIAAGRRQQSRERAPDECEWLGADQPAEPGWNLRVPPDPAGGLSSGSAAYSAGLLR